VVTFESGCKGDTWTDLPGVFPVIPNIQWKSLQVVWPWVPPLFHPGSNNGSAKRKELAASVTDRGSGVGRESTFPQGYMPSSSGGGLSFH
jgi:hypothetical protein